MKILVVDDEETMVRSLSTLLAQEGYGVAVAADGPQAIEAARAERPDLILLDVMLPGMDGLEVGADDYVTKPFSSRELVARVKAQLRRSQMQAQDLDRERFVAGDVEIDVASRRITVAGKNVVLSPKEFDLLKVLVGHAGRVLGRDFLLNAVWGQDFFGDTRTLDVHIRWLREKVEENPSKPVRIETVHGVGYRFRG